jgi:predicted nucleic acid-binding protein
LRILIDADVLIDLALDRAPHSSDASRILEAVQKGQAAAVVAWHTVSNVYYVLCTWTDRARALGFIRDLSMLVEIAPVDSAALRIALALQMRDFEDAMQVASALAASVDVIVTRNVRDFRTSPVRAVKPADLQL